MCVCISLPAASLLEVHSRRCQAVQPQGRATLLPPSPPSPLPPSHTHSQMQGSAQCVWFGHLRTLTGTICYVQLCTCDIHVHVHVYLVLTSSNFSQCTPSHVDCGTVVIGSAQCHALTLSNPSLCDLHYQLSVEQQQQQHSSNDKGATRTILFLRTTTCSYVYASERIF